MLSLLLGDWNFTDHRHDRFCKKKADWTGDRQLKETDAFTSLVIRNHHFQEVFQPLHTHEDGLTRSRLDRIYINHHAVDTLHKECKAWTRNFQLELSHHRPVLFTRRAKERKNNIPGTHSPLPALGYNHLLLKSRLEEKWEHMAGKLTTCSPVEQLQSYRAAMRKVAQ